MQKHEEKWPIYGGQDCPRAFARLGHRPAPFPAMNRRFFRFGLLLAALSFVPAHAEQVVISEILYAPPPGQAQFVEIFNNTVTVFDVAEWRVSGGVKYSFPGFSTNQPGLTFLKPFERILLSGIQPDAFRTGLKLPDSVRVFGPWTGQLSGRGDRLSLKDKNGVGVCMVQYGTRGHWPVAATAGHSLELRDANRAIDDWRNWTASALSGGTPGAAPAPDPARAERSRNLPHSFEERPSTPRLNEVHFKRGRVDWIELFNPLEPPLPSAGLFLSARPDFSDRVAVTNTLPSRGCVSCPTTFALGTNGDLTIYLVDAARTVIDARVFKTPPIR